MTAYAAVGCRLYVGGPVDPLLDIEFDRHDWTEVARVETIGNTRIAGGIEIVARGDDADVGQGTLRAAAVSRTTRAFRIAFPDGTERRFAARVVSARDRASDTRLRAVLAVASAVRRHEPEMVT